MCKYGVMSGPYFPVFGSEITPYLGTFHGVKLPERISDSLQLTDQKNSLIKFMCH